MTEEKYSLSDVYKGWDGYQVGLVRAIAPLMPEQLAYRPAPHLRSAGEIARHISQGRLNWFQRALGGSNSEAASWRPEDGIEKQAAELVRGLEITWRMVEDALQRWTVADLAQPYPLSYQEKTTRSRASGFSGAQAIEEGKNPTNFHRIGE